MRVLVGEAADYQLRGRGTDAYWRMFPEYVPDVVEKNDDERVRELEKIAA
jgi:hypothetical protein